MDYYKIITKLIGPIDPVGESNEDDRRFARLGVTTALVEDLLTDIIRVAQESGRPEASIRQAGKYAKQFLKDLPEQIELL